MIECPICGSPNCASSNMEQEKLGYEITKPVELEQIGWHLDGAVLGLNIQPPPKGWEPVYRKVRP